MAPIAPLASAKGPVPRRHNASPSGWRREERRQQLTGSAVEDPGVPRAADSRTSSRLPVASALRRVSWCLEDSERLSRRDGRRLPPCPIAPRIGPERGRLASSSNSATIASSRASESRIRPQSGYERLEWDCDLDVPRPLERKVDLSPRCFLCLHERPNNDHPGSHRRDMQRPGDAVAASQSQFPQGPFQLSHDWRAEAFQPYAANALRQLYKACLNVRRQGGYFIGDHFIENLDLPGHSG